MKKCIVNQLNRCVELYRKEKWSRIFYVKLKVLRCQFQFKLIYIFFVLIMFQCNNDHINVDPNKSCESLIIKAKINKDSLGFNELIDSLLIIQLETNNNSLFGDITKLEVLDDTIVIFDFFNQVILCFDLNGSFLHKIGNKGKGPDELLHISNFAVDKPKKEVLVFDDRKLKIFHFGLGGNLISMEDAKIYPFDFAPHKNNYLFFQNKSPFFFDEKTNFDLIYTNKNRIVHGYFPFNQELSFRYPLNRVFYELNDTICFVDKWNAKVYSFINGEISQRFCVDFMGDEIPIEFTENEKIFDSEQKKYAYLYDYVIENKSYIYIRYLWKGELRKLLYNKESKRYHTFSNKIDNSDLLSISFAPIYSYDDFFVSKIPTYLIVGASQKGLLKTDVFKNSLSTVKESDNLLLAFFRLRK